jgi:hypothetical protein
MAKKGLQAKNAKGVLRTKTGTSGWVLCVGAGVSQPAFPDWVTLVKRLIARDVGPGGVAQLARLQARYSPDAFIRAAIERLQLTETDFADVLVDDLYQDARTALSATDWDEFIRVLDCRHLGRATLKRWRHFHSIVTAAFPTLSALPMAEAVAEVLGTRMAPAAILSFNAEPLFAALINACYALRRGKVTLPDVLTYITHVTTDRRPDRVPFIFCHGLLPVPGTSGHTLSSVDKLVFSESAYLQLANSAFSWQSATFLQFATSHSILFVGLSLADPNIRRWLAWVHAVRVSELSEVGAPSPTSTVHYWIARDPGNSNERQWAEALVSHLGVRVIWVQDHTEIGPTFRSMLSLAPPAATTAPAGAPP